jgi:hypothetical protein
LNGGTILSAPKIVTVTWAGDPNADALEAFDDAIGGSTYWQTAVSEYGVGPATSGPTMHVRVTDPPPTTITDNAMEQFIATKVSAAPASGWPASDSQTIYTVYLSAATTLTSAQDGTDECNNFDAYHGEVRVSAALPHVVFAIIVQKCHDTQSALEYSTQSGSHELAEAATDPHPYTDVGLSGFDPDHLSWELFNLRDDENGDACEYYDDAYYTETGSLSYSVQRLWSDRSAAAGHNPCVPQANPYYSVTAVDTEEIMVIPPDNTTSQKTHGFHVPVGAQKSFTVGFYSDAPLPGPDNGWDIEAVEGDASITPPPGNMTLSLDKTHGKNGDTAQVTVTINALGKGNAQLLTIISKRKDLPHHYMPILIGAY